MREPTRTIRVDGRCTSAMRWHGKQPDVVVDAVEIVVPWHTDDEPPDHSEYSDFAFGEELDKTHGPDGVTADRPLLGFVHPHFCVPGGMTWNPPSPMTPMPRLEYCDLCRPKPKDSK